MRIIDATSCGNGRHFDGVRAPASSRAWMPGWLHKYATVTSGSANLAKEAPLTV
jgi:hypothetical protein